MGRPPKEYIKNLIKLKILEVLKKYSSADVSGIVLALKRPTERPYRVRRTHSSNAYFSYKGVGIDRNRILSYLLQLEKEGKVVRIIPKSKRYPLIWKVKEE